MKPFERKSAKGEAPRRAQDVDRALIRDLAELLNATDLTEIEVEQSGLRVRVSRQINAAPMTYAAAPPMAVPAATARAVDAAVAPAAPTSDLSKHPGAVTSPMVGTAYASPKPGDPPFVTVGATVKEGQTLLIIEAMKTMNPLLAPRAGKVTQILVNDASPVEFGQLLMIIE